MSGLTRDRQHIYRASYDGREEVLPSVTTITGLLDKGFGIRYWTREQVALAALRHRDELARMAETSGAEATAKWLIAATDKALDDAASLGTHVHALTEQLDRGEDVVVPAEARPFVDGYLTWRASSGVQWLAIEEMVVGAGYAGTLDRIGAFGDRTILCDIKTGRSVDYKGRVYDEILLQLHAYAAAFYIGRPNDPQKYVIPIIHGLAVIHVRPEGTRFIEVPMEPASLAAFVRLLDVHRWKGRAA